MPEEKPLDKLIAIEWDVIQDLQKQLEGEVSPGDMVKISNSLAYHVNTLNKLLAEKGERLAGEETLGQVVMKLPKKFRDAFVRRMRKWIRRPSSAKYLQTLIMLLRWQKLYGGMHALLDRKVYRNLQKGL